MVNIRVGFIANKLTLRGTEVNLYDLADFNEKILKNESIIITRPYDYVMQYSPRDVSKMAYSKFENRFKVCHFRYPNWGIPNESPREIRDIVKREKIDVLFVEKAGSRNDGLVFDYCPTIIHAVFTTEDPHGTIYSSISDFLNVHFKTNYPVIPYMVRVAETDEDLRESLNIPKDVLVFGSMSGADEFTVDYVRRVVEKVVNEERNIYFVFLNIDKFGPESKRLIFLPGTADMIYKRKFINTCDAMLYGRANGETFGLACGEFSICNKPVIGRANESSRAHEDILGDAMIKHTNYSECYDIVTNWEKHKKDVSNNGYKRYTPEKVMKILESNLNIALNRIKRVYFNGFWSGFDDCSNAVNKKFFLELLREIYSCNIEISDITNADILIENTQTSNSLLKTKKWETTYLFSGESYIKSNTSEYDCVLYGRRNNGNIVNVPLFVPYLKSSYDKVNYPKVTKIPEKDALVIISNPGGKVRNEFLDKLEKMMKVDYGGGYRTNIERIMHNYNTKEFLEIVSDYKYIVSMENSEEDTYITEKIMHGLLAGCMPIYWGSPRVLDYFNERRIVLKDEVKLLSNEEWLNRVNENALTKFGESLTVQEIARQVRNVINRKDYKYPEITEVYCICNKEYEEVRYSRMSKLLREFVNEDRIRIMGSTYKNTIDDIIYNKYVKRDLVLNMRPIPTRRSELSLTLNWLEVLEDIERRYKDGIFLILESDVEILELSESYSLEEYSFNRALKQLSRESGKWDCISFGYSKKEELNISYNPYKTPYRDNIDTTEILKNSINDLNVPEDKIIFHRKFNPRCTDNLLFSYSGIQKLLNHMKRDENYGVPFDYYFMNFLESEMRFKFYWSNITYFNQLTNQGKESSTIQCDKK